MAGILDLAYTIAVLLVSVGGLIGMWWLTRGDHEESGVKWQGLLVAAAASLFIIAMIGQFLVTLLTGG